VAATILERSHRPAAAALLVGVDAEGLAAGRARISDEEWARLGGELTDEDTTPASKRYFGIDL